MKTFFLKTKTWIAAHKTTVAVIVLVLAVSAYGAHKVWGGAATETRYVLGMAKQGNIISSITGTGQVSSSNQADITSKSSGKLIYLNAKSGQQVSAGTLIAEVDPGNAGYELETAKLSYQKAVTVDPDDLRDAQNADRDAKEDFMNSYVSARATLTAASTDMSDVLEGVEDLLSGGYIDPNNQALSTAAKNYSKKVEDSFYPAQKLLSVFTKKYATVSKDTSDEEIEAFLSQAYDVSVSLVQTVKYAQDAVTYLRDHEEGNSGAADTAYTSVGGLMSTANENVTSISEAKSSITTNKRAVETAEINLKDLKDGPDVLDLRSQELSLKQKQDAYEDYFIRAPFDGIIASVDGIKGQNVSSSTTIATMITKQKIAEISLNELDAAKVKVGQKAALTFDALSDLTIEGEVIEVDLVGTVSQGVVNYEVKIGFDVDDERVKPGMTVSTDIVTEMKENVLTIPASAVKTLNGESYVMVFDPELPAGRGNQGVTSAALPTRVRVTIGISDDTNIEILSGLTEGQQIVNRTIVGASTTTTTPAAAGGASTTRTRTNTGFGAAPRF